MKKIFAIVLCFMLLLGVSAFADEEKMIVGTVSNGELSAYGTGTVVVPADMATVSLGVRYVDPEVSNLQNEMNSRIARIRQALVDLGIEDDDITTGYLNIWANYNDYSDDISPELGSTEEAPIATYTGQNILNICVKDIDMCGQVIDTAFAAGANSMYGITFGLKDDSKARDEAYKLAVEDAMHKAFVVAGAANSSPTGVKSIDIVDSYVIGNDRAMGVSMDTVNSYGASVSTDVKASGIEVTASVSMTFVCAGE